MKVWCVDCKSPHAVMANVVMVRSQVNPDVWVCLMCGKTVGASP